MQKDNIVRVDDPNNKDEPAAYAVQEIDVDFFGMFKPPIDD